MPPNSDPNSSHNLKVEFSVKVKRLHPTAKLPERGTDWSAGADLSCLEAFTLEPGERKVVSTGLIVEIPPGWYGRVAPRSGLAVRHGIDTLAGIVDPDFRGELMVVIVNHGDATVSFGAGERIAQLVIERAAICDYVLAEDLSETARGDSGFGSTGK